MRSSPASTCARHAGDLGLIAEIDTAGAMLLQRTAASWHGRRAAHPLFGRDRSLPHPHRGGEEQEWCRAPKIETREPLKQFVEDGTKAITGVGTDALLLTNFLGEVTLRSAA